MSGLLTCIAILPGLDDDDDDDNNDDHHDDQAAAHELARALLQALGLHQRSRTCRDVLHRLCDLHTIQIIYDSNS